MLPRHRQILLTAGLSTSAVDGAAKAGLTFIDILLLMEQALATAGKVIPIVEQALQALIAALNPTPPPAA